MAPTQNGRDREKFLRVQLLCLALIGIKRHETVSSRTIFHVCFISMVIMDLATILFALEHANDIALVCDCLGPTFTAYLGIVKQYCLSAHRVELWNIIETLRRLKDYAGTSEIESIERNNKIDRFLATAYLMSASATGSLFIIAALAKGCYKLIFQNIIEWGFPLSLSFPFKTSHPIVFGVFFVWSSAAIYIVVFCSVSSDASFGGLASNVVVHFKLLQKRLQDATFADNDENLKQLIEYHSLLLNLSRKIMSSFRVIIINNLLVASVLLCVLGFQLVMFLGSTLMLIYLMYVTAIVIQITFFAYYGSLLSHESEEVSSSIYCSNWYEASPKTRRILLQCLMRAQVPVNTKAGFMVASLPTLRAILNSAGSYVALLLSFTDN
ncbi:AAEL013217-PA [Aedes aegypti]|uniref:Odorant receptor n=2 Tax=Aedes aegypti TaxID=7159 RepID=A0A1S7UED1_AEDAE|nr:AAEL013217-PA [Aedes aegypti]DAA80377.1 TPA_exp: odorant receptor 31 [Aedes aegypti]